MKIKYIIPILIISLFSVACSTDDDTDVNELEGLTKVQELSNNTHSIELYTANGQFSTGYNAISIRIKDNVSNTYIENASLTWNPVMQMPTMQHSCPKSTVAKVSGKTTVYEGYIIYQMANLDGSGWSLSVNYTVNGVSYDATGTIVVKQAAKQNVTSFMGSDNKRYIIALLEPKMPKIGNNKMVVGLYKMENMMSFPVVENYTITLDPRMPSMENHSSPNNTDLTYKADDTMYHGNLSLTMTGYWVLNLKLLNAQNEVLKGENITLETVKSSLYLELEF
ncbi:hypothetical protein [Mariniflexile maritimum]|jgi:hypothetical protein|uniref:hypothetical protein n=1 Tax=Mariniflexile maritimum TaxID=2682493 RepID=UPI0012F6589D|nr:hypothetical protein [Mariniflexile maritimum]